MKRTAVRASMIRSTLFAAVLAVAVGSGTLAFAQASDDWASGR